MKKSDIVPVLLGSGLSTYTIACFFYEEYHVKSYLLNSRNSDYTENSKFIIPVYIKNFTENGIFLYNLLKFGKENSDKKLFLFANSDEMANKIIHNYEYLKKYFICPCVNKDLARRLDNKEYFYEICKKYGLDCPKTIVVTKENFKDIKLPFDFPVAVKATESVEYSFIQFPGKKKAYKCNSKKELEETVNEIYNNGYSGHIVVQEYIEGETDSNFVLNSYSSKDGKVKVMSLGRIYLEDTKPERIGNYLIIKSEYNKEIYDKIKKFLEDIKFVGFSNIDLKYDAKDKKYKVLEVNLRLGKSNSYIYPAGCNPIKYLVQDYLENNQDECDYTEKEILWTLIRMRKIKKYINDPKRLEKINELKKAKKIYNPLFYKEDRSLKRLVSVYKVLKREEIKKGYIMK